MFIIYFVLCLLSLHHLYKIENFYEKSQYGRTNVYEYLLIFVGVLLCALLFEFVKIVTRKFILNNMSDHKRLIETKEQRLYRIQIIFNSAIYYFWISVINFYLIKKYEIDYLPKYLGGKLEISNFLGDWPRQIAFPVRAILMISIGHHLERTYSHLRYKRNAGDFWTMILHHLVTITLMVNCFGHRQFLFGVPILLIHDMSDFFVNTMRLVREIKPWKKYTLLFYFLFVLVWLITRNFIFNFEIVFPLWTKEFWKFHINRDLNHIFASLGIGILMILNTFWLYAALIAGYRKIFQNKEVSKFEGEIADSKEDSNHH